MGLFLNFYVNINISKHERIVFLDVPSGNFVVHIAEKKPIR
jgi:hypothetical protein